MSRKSKSPGSRRTGYRWLDRPGRVCGWMLGLAFLLYLPQLGGAFIFDDIHYVQYNPFLSDWHTLIHWKQFLHSRPLYWLSFFIQKQMWGNTPMGYKIVSVLAHGLSAFFLYLAIRQILLLKKQEHPWLPLVSGVLFLVSPVTTEAVCYISGQNNGLGGLFFIVSLWKFLRALDPKAGTLRKKRIIHAILFMVAAFLFKEVYLVGFLLLPAILLWLGNPTRRQVTIGIASAGLVVLLAVAATYTLNIQPFPRIRHGLSGHNPNMFSQRALATNTYAVATALRLTLFPDKLNIDHDLPIIAHIRDPRALGAAALLLLFGVALFLLRRRVPMGLPAYLAWLLLLAPTNSLILRHGAWMVDPLSERNLYAPTMAAALLMTALLFAVIRSKPVQHWVVLVLILAFSGRTVARTMAFRDNISLWRASVRSSPNRARPHYNLAAALVQAGRSKEALPHARKAVQLSPESHCFGMLANIYRDLKQPTLAEHTLREGIRTVGRKKYLLMSQLGQFYYERGQFHQAERQLRHAIQAKPRLVLPRITLTYILMSNGRVREAGNQLAQLDIIMGKQVRTFRPEEIISARYRALLAFGRGWYLLDTGREVAGIRSLKQATSMDPGFVEPYLKLGEYFYRNRRYTDAWNWFLKASRLKDFGRYSRQAGPYLRNLPKLLANPDLDPGL